MQVYIYTARSKPGELIRGEIEAENESAAAKVLIGKDLFPIVVYEKKERGLSSLNPLNRITQKDKVFFARQFSTLINAGLPVAQSLETLVEQTTKTALRKVIDQIFRDIESGASLSQAFSRYKEVFSRTEVALIASGEASGTLDKTLTRLSNQLEKDFALRRKIRSAFTYPTIVIIVVILVVAIMIMFVVPKLEGLYSEFKAELPFLTRVMIGLSRFMIDYWWLVIIMIVATVVAFKNYINTPSGRRSWDGFKLKVPLLKILMQKIYLARFSRTMGTLIGSGVSVLDSLGIVANTVGNVIYYEAILKAGEQVKRGTALSQPIKENPVFPALVSQMVRVGEQTGELETILTNLANFYEEEVDNIVKNLSSILEPIIIVFTGAIVGTILFAIMLPIYTLSRVIFK